MHSKHIVYFIGPPRPHLGSAITQSHGLVLGNWDVQLLMLKLKLTPPLPSEGSTFLKIYQKVALTWPRKDVSSVFLKFKQCAYIYIQSEFGVSLAQPCMLFLNTLFKMLSFLCHT